MPLVDLGRQPAKATVGEPFPVQATVFREGHDKLGAEVVLTGPDGQPRPPVRMTKLDDPVDRYLAWVTPDQEGAWTFEVQAWSDPIATWQYAAGLKIPAGVDVELMFAEGVLLLERVLEGLPARSSDRKVVTAAVAAAKDTKPPGRGAARPAPVARAHRRARPAPHPRAGDRRGPLSGVRRSRAGAVRQLVRVLPAFGGRDPRRHAGKVTSGNFRTAAKRLEAVAAMGFDVVYLPPIHPIGEVNRKGPNNTLTPGPDDTGSPWAIGSKDGGHDAIHPDLGDFDDFDAFVARAADLGLEVALDLALQAAPDHPWVTSHPEFFTTRADGTIAYAENPPKKYQDIYPINFDNDPSGICREVLRVVRLWMSHGVRIFRVDNPHTKPLPFWEWLLAEVRRTDPDVLFLAEAFTKPPMMHALGAIGYHQSYTYFTWRTARWELEDYLREVSSRDRPRDAAQLLRQHPRHPPRLPPVRRPRGVQDPRGARGDQRAELGRVRRLRALRARRGQARQRGVPRLGEVPDPDPRLGGRRGRGPQPGAVPHPAQRDPPRAPCAPAAAQPHHPLQRRREHPGVLEAGRRTTS